MNIIIKNILSDIEAKYLSLNEPNYSFVNQALKQKPYNSLQKSLRDLFNIKDITDSNYDVSFQYVISKENKEWLLELSMVGLYAIVSRIMGDGSTELIATNEENSRIEQKIISLLQEHQFEILKKKVLEYPIDMNLLNASNVHVFQALFSDVDILPWSNLTR